MSFEQLANVVLKNSIKNVVCIDDKYCEPYEQDSEGKEFEASQKLFKSFKEDVFCQLDIHSYVDSNKWNLEKDYILKNKDLVILDWELNLTEDPSYKDSLLVLKNIIDLSNTKFVVIYTNATDTDLIAKNLHSYFNMFRNDDLNNDEIVLKIRELLEVLGFDDVDTLEKQIVKTIDGYVLNQEYLKDRIDKCCSFFKNKRDCGKLIKSIKKYGFYDLNEFLYWFECMNDKSLVHKTDNINYSFEQVSKKPYGFIINNKIILVIEKKEVSPDKLFNKFSEMIHNYPNNFTTLLTLEILNKIADEYPLLNNKLSNIDEKAIFYHLKNYTENYNEFYQFLLKSWTAELEQYCLNYDSELLQKIEEYKKLKSIRNDELKPTTQLNNELVKLAYNLSCVVPKEKSRELRFGDIFIHRDSFFLCITPHCDCLNAKKIRNNFHFIKGNKGKTQVALENAETGYYSFVIIEDKPIIIEWNCKPFTSYVTTNDIAKLQLTYCGGKLALKHIAVLKENYTQRIANNSFSYANRVGIDLPHIAEADKQTISESLLNNNTILELKKKKTDMIYKA